ncbi:9777_t:CDS:2 [Diversispora eburnea]|uniref:9777_t:CDS:1 n=1 Tax=Diversispora eburnea TaxID=1213867 RepID=A0A9N8VUL3_9GLOM|nr:9777_t:CDS:2 [Diversispora eburnea]
MNEKNEKKDSPVIITQNFVDRLRSKSKRRFRAIKRQSVFAPVENARLDRLVAKEAEDINTQIIHQQLQKEETKETSTGMEVDIPKISTSGPRNSRHYKRKLKRKGII